MISNNLKITIMRNKFLFILFLIPLFGIFSGCQNEKNETPVVNEEQIIDMNQYGDFQAAAKACVPDLLELNHLVQQGSTRAIIEQDVAERCLIIQDIMLPSAKGVINDIGFTVQDLNEMFETNYQYLEQADSEVVALSLFMNLMQQNIVTTRSSFTDCFLEATGIAAGVALVGGLGGAVMGKQAVKAAVKVAMKLVGRQMLGGIGLVLMAGEITWCMTR
jgi:hypothetical protein